MNYITKAEELALSKHIDCLLKRPNIKKYNFPKQKVLKAFRYIYKNEAVEDCRNVSIFVFGNNKPNSEEFVFATAMEQLINQHCPNNGVILSSKTKKSIMLVGKPTDEILSKTNINWDEAHITESTAKIPIKFPIRRKLKCFNNEKIYDIMNLIRDNKIQNKIVEKEFKKVASNKRRSK